MQKVEERLRFAPTDLASFLRCRHLTALSRDVAVGDLPGPRHYRDPWRKALADAGRRHEQRVVQALSESGLAVREIREDRVARTLQSMREGADAIYQGRLADGDWSGFPDFLVRVDRPSDFGTWSYEVMDAKLTRVPSADAVLQIAVYSWLLGEIQGVTPRAMHLALATEDSEPCRRETFRVANFAAFERAIRRRFESHCASPGETYPEPVSWCDRCDWNASCRDRRREDDHLSLVAGATRHQRHRLEKRGIGTLADFARLDLPLQPRLEGVQTVTVEKIHRQAAVQLEGRRRDLPHFELREPEGGLGLLALPEPSEGDLYFDIESSRVITGPSREYLFGLLDRNDTYRPLWAFDEDEERRIFERFMDFVAERRTRHPDFHIYHYGPYETGALKRLMSRYATREDAMDDLLRRRVFVDLLQVVRQGIVAAVEGYSLKDMEPFHGFDREQPLPEASRARVELDAALARGEVGAADSKTRMIVERYNREDCLSTASLHSWLEDRRRELAARIGPRPRPTVVVEPDQEQKQSEAAQRVEELAKAIRASDPEDPARRLLGWLLDYYRREDKSAWWDYFRRLEMDAEELLEDRSVLGGLEFQGHIGRVARSGLYAYRFPSQDHDIRAGDSPDGFRVGGAAEDARGAGAVWDLSGGRLILKRGPKVAERPHPEALVKDGVVPNKGLREALFHLGETVGRDGFDERSRYRAAFDLLRRIPPRSSSGASLLQDGETPIEGARRLALSLDREVLAVQGPPGSGKTYLGARVVTALLAKGRRVGVTAQSHKVITNLLKAVVKAADEEGVSFRGMQVNRHGKGCADDRIEIVSSGEAETARDRVQLIAGTAWVWARPGMRRAVDTLVVDEAGQFSLAHTLASAPAARNLILLGDPRQLDQVTQGVHPEGSDASALGHFLGDEKTISPDRGLLLRETWRMHPSICAFTSELFYEGKLTSRPGLERQRIEDGPLPGAGLRFVPVEHDGNQRESPEEVERIRALTQALMRDAKWTDADGETRRVTSEDILVIAPYNAQVDLLRKELDDGIQVGTVDRFQGREAPVVFYSMATSTPEAAPRGMDFLYSLNRLNVATSRARCIAVVVASPELFFPECRTPQQMRLANAFCRFHEMADRVV